MSRLKIAAVQMVSTPSVERNLATARSLVAQAAEQGARLVALPEGRGLWMTYARYLTIDGNPIHERGLRPTVAVESPSVAFDDPLPTTDDMLAKAIERLTAGKTAR